MPGWLRNLGKNWMQICLLLSNWILKLNCYQVMSNFKKATNIPCSVNLWSFGYWIFHRSSNKLQLLPNDILSCPVLTQSSWIAFWLSAYMTYKCTAGLGMKIVTMMVTIIYTYVCVKLCDSLGVREEHFYCMSTVGGRVAVYLTLTEYICVACHWCKVHLCSMLTLP